jgi:hypothetical protein
MQRLSSKQGRNFTMVMIKQCGYLLAIITSVLLVGGCSSLGAAKPEFSYFHQQDSFNIAGISLHKISILGLIDDSGTLTPKQKEQMSQIIYTSFARQVDFDSLVNTESFAESLGIEQYQLLKQAAEQNQSEQISQIMQRDQQLSRYLLISRLTDSSNYNEQQTLVHRYQDCTRYGHSLGLTMTIIDTQTNIEVWAGHLNKSSKVNYCDDDDDYSISSDDDDRHASGKQVLAGIFIWLLLDAIVDSSHDSSDKLASNDFNSLFNQAVEQFAQRLPSFFH